MLVNRENLQNAINKIDLPELGEKISGKVRDSYVQKDKRIIIVSDRISAFDVVLGVIPFKGQILNQLSSFWFEQTKDLVPNHVIETPDPNVIVVKNCEVYPIEVIVRAYITGSGWRDYQKGLDISGISLPKGLKKNQKLPAPIITPSTKADMGLHDEPISREDIISRGLVDEDEYKIIEEYAMKLFNKATQIAQKQGLIFVDTKYEFGKDKDGNICVVDEIHTQDSSRYWYKDSYESRFNNNEEPEQLDKEDLRGWLIGQGFMGEGTPPKLTNEILEKTLNKYIKTYETLTGQRFVPQTGNTIKRIQTNLKKYI